MHTKQFSTEERVKSFWNWFHDHASDFLPKHPTVFNYDVLRDIHVHLQEIDPNLTPEINFPESATDNYCLVISADGVRESFRNVKMVVEMAPLIPRWKFIAFRQPDKNQSLTMNHSGISLDSSEIKFAGAWDEKKNFFHLVLYHSAYKEEKDWQSAMFLMLDKVLGEYLMGEKVGAISFLNLSEADPNILPLLRPLSDLREVMFAA